MMLVLRKLKMAALLLLLSFQGALFAQKGEGVKFLDLTYEEALAKAKAENKLVFMDCYRTWCGPCVKMAEKVFTQAAAGEYFNSRFVCVKYDLQHVSQEFADEMAVLALPTFFIIRPDRTKQHAIAGYWELDKFIARVEQGLNKKTSLHYLNRQYEQGKLKKKQYPYYISLLENLKEREKCAKVRAEYEEKYGGLPGKK